MEKDWSKELGELKRRQADVCEMGGAERIERQHAADRMTVRERIDKLSDADTFHEIGTVAGIAEYDENGDLVKLAESNCVMGRAKINGRPVITGLARLDGWPVAILASGPLFSGGAWTADACKKSVSSTWQRLFTCRLFTIVTALDLRWDWKLRKHEPSVWAYAS